MNFYKNILVLKIIALLFIFLFTSCEDVNTSSIFDEDTDTGNTPVISSVEPSEFALAGYDEITITGNYFSDVLDDENGNKVYFDNELAQIISATKNELKVISPVKGGEDFLIKVVVPGALNFGEFAPYKLKLIAEKISGVAVIDEITALAMDLDDNLYMHLLSDNVYKISPDGTREEYAEIPFPKASDMKYGKENYIYVLRSNNQTLYRIPPGGGAAIEYVTFASRMRGFDFDNEQNIYALGTRTGTHVYTSTGNLRELNAFSTLDVWEVKIHEDFLYVAARGSGGGIFRAPITSSNGDLGSEEEVFSWSNAMQFADNDILGFGISANGDVIVTTSNSPDPILNIAPDGIATPLYEGVLIPPEVSSVPVTNIVWGNDESFFISRYNSNSDSTASNGVYKVFYGQGTNYFGR